MTLRTFYAYDHEAPRETGPASEPVDDRHSIKWGYNLADLGKFARYAMSRHRSRAVSSTDAYQEAWSAIAEALAVSDTDPGPQDLIYAGWAAINRLGRAEAHTHGIDPTTSDEIPRFTAYWSHPTTPSPETAVIERTALYQILPALTPRQRQALNALAATEDAALAAAALDCNGRTALTHLANGRKRFRELWHEGETPPRTMGGINRPTMRRNSGRGRITESQLDTIRGQYHAGSTLNDLAAEYGMSRSGIHKYLTGAVRPAPDPVETS